MTDIKIITTDEYFDINIEAGHPEYLAQEQQNEAQRAALCAVISKGTIPGMLSNGIDWSALYQNESDLISINNQAQTQIQNYVDMRPGANYMPVIMNDADGVHVTVVRTA